MSIPLHDVEPDVVSFVRNSSHQMNSLQKELRDLATIAIIRDHATSNFIVKVTPLPNMVSNLYVLYMCLKLNFKIQQVTSIVCVSTIRAL